MCEGYIVGIHSRYGEVTRNFPVAMDDKGIIFAVDNIEPYAYDFQTKPYQYHSEAFLRGRFDYSNPLPYGVRQITVDTSCFNYIYTTANFTKKIYVTDETGTVVAQGVDTIDLSQFADDYGKKLYLHVEMNCNATATVTKEKVTYDARISSIKLTY